MFAYLQGPRKGRKKKTLFFSNNTEGNIERQEVVLSLGAENIIQMIQREEKDGKP